MEFDVEHTSGLVVATERGPSPADIAALHEKYPHKVEDVQGGQSFSWEGSKTRTKVVTVEVAPNGCRGKVHINRSQCYDRGTPVRIFR